VGEEPSWLSATAEEESRYRAWKQLSPGGVGMPRYTAMLQYVDEMHEQCEGGIKGRLDKVAGGGADSDLFVADLDAATAALFCSSVAAIARYDEKWERTVEEAVTLHALFCQATVGDCNQVSGYPVTTTTMTTTSVAHGVLCRRRRCCCCCCCCST